MFTQVEELSRYRLRGMVGTPVSETSRLPLSRTTESPVRNELLQSLPEEALDDLRPYLERVPLKRRQMLHERNLAVTHAYFIERGLASLLARSGDHSALEVSTFGRCDFVGLPLVLGTARTPYRCVVQVPGEALRISADDLQEALSVIPALQHLLLRYVQARTVQSTQLVVCNTRHPLRQRLARWLLFAHDRSDGDMIPVTHQVLGRALGVRRAGVTTAMGRMEEAGLIHRGRGRLVILDRARLEEEACECYRIMRSEHGRIVCREVSEPPLTAVNQ